MNEHLLARFKKRLVDERQQVIGLAQSNSDAVNDVTLDQTSVGRLSRMDAMQDQAMSLELERRAQAQLQRIAAALQRIDEGDYGYCEECGEEIVAERLELDPAVRLCVSCAGRRERAGR